MSTPSRRRLLARRLQVPADPLGITSRLRSAGLPQVCLLHSAEATEAGYDGPRRSFVAAAPSAQSVSIDPYPEDPHCFDPGSPLAAVPRWIGAVPYECRRGLERPAKCRPDKRAAPLLSRPLWWRFDAVVCVDHDAGEVMVVGSCRRAVERLQQAAGRAALPQSSTGALAVEVREAEPAAVHLTRISRAIELIVAGDLYQVNLARYLEVQLRSGDVLSLYGRLVATAPASYAALLELDDVVVLATSPELLLRATPPLDAATGEASFDRLVTEPIKGTRPRGVCAETDRQLARELDEDAKERAELAMIIDVERNDLGSVARAGSVRLSRPAHVVTHRTIHHRKARLVANARPDLSRQAVLEAMLPSGSVTGAPKISAMQLIAKLESRRRGLYTGGYGYVDHRGQVVLAMAIRTLVLKDGKGGYFSGGGIVVDSDPETELRETGWKAIQLLRSLDP